MNICINTLHKRDKSLTIIIIIIIVIIIIIIMAVDTALKMLDEDSKTLITQSVLELTILLW
jgi:flagellar basal body-associated protein FliL